MLLILPSTIGADDPSNGFIEVTSSSLAEQQQTSVGYQVGAIEATFRYCSKSQFNILLLIIPVSS